MRHKGKRQIKFNNSKQNSTTKQSQSNRFNNNFIVLFYF
jgi:hypothetical protein